MSRWPGRLVLVVLSLLVGSGCGAAHAKPAPTKARYIAQADAICRYGDEKLQRAAAIDRAPIALFKSVPALIRQAVAIHELANAKLEALPRPTGETATLERWLTARIVATTVESDTAEAPIKGDTTAVRDVQRELLAARAFARRLAGSYGFTVCGRSE